VLARPNQRAGGPLSFYVQGTPGARRETVVPRLSTARLVRVFPQLRHECRRRIQSRQLAAEQGARLQRRDAPRQPRGRAAAARAPRAWIQLLVLQRTAVQRLCWRNRFQRRRDHRRSAAGNDGQCVQSRNGTGGPGTARRGLQRQVCRYDRQQGHVPSPSDAAGPLFLRRQLSLPRSAADAIDDRSAARAAVDHRRGLQRVQRVESLRLQRRRDEHRVRTPRSSAPAGRGLFSSRRASVFDGVRT